MIGSMANWDTKLRILMALCRDSQRDIAAQVGVNAGTLNRWLTGAHEPRISEAIKLADAYGLTLDQLFNPSIQLPTEITRKFVVQQPADEIEQNVLRAASDPPAPIATPAAQPPAAQARAHGTAPKPQHRKK